MATLRAVDTHLPRQAKEARWWEPEAAGKVHCYLCPRHCHIGEGHNGIEFVIAIRPPPNDVQGQIYFGVGPLGNEHLISRLSARSCFRRAW